MDFYTGKAEVDRDELENIPPEPKNVWESMFTHVRTQLFATDKKLQRFGSRLHDYCAGTGTVVKPLLAFGLLVCWTVADRLMDNKKICNVSAIAMMRYDCYFF